MSWPEKCGNCAFRPWDWREWRKLLKVSRADFVEKNASTFDALVPSRR
jgi:hypothetical protein